MINGNALRLAGPGAHGKGAAWHDGLIDLSHGFTAEFTFEITEGEATNDNRIRDGMAFVIQSVGQTAIGGGHLGYNDLASSVAIEFDTFVDSHDNGMTGPHVSVQPGGQIQHLASLGSAHASLHGVRTARVVYSPGDGTLEVWLEAGSDPNFPTDPLVSVGSFNLPSLLDGATKAYFGFTAHSPGGNNGQAHDLLAFRVEIPVYPVDITVTGSPGVPGVTAVATNIATGEHFFAITDGEGKATFLLPEGEYIFSAYRFKITNPLALVMWPSLFDNIFPIDVPSLDGYTPVVWHPEEGSLERNPSNLLKALGGGVKLGPGQQNSADIGLQMQRGARVQCVLLDPDGQPVKQGKAYGVIPVGDHPLLPPHFFPEGVDPALIQYVKSLPRGIGFGIANLSEGCALLGAPAGPVVLETEPIEINGKKFVYRASRNVGSSGDYSMVAGPSPMLIGTTFLGEPIGDARGPQDFGHSIYYGWDIENPNGAGEKQPTRTFVVTSQFRGNGNYNLDFWLGDDPPNGQTRLTVGAVCEAKRCKISPSSPRLPAGVTATAWGVSASSEGAEFGTVVWEVTFPSSTSHTWHVPVGETTNSMVSFQIWAGSSRNNPSDRFDPPGHPNFLTSTRKSGFPGTYGVAGIM